MSDVRGKLSVSAIKLLSKLSLSQGRKFALLIAKVINRRQTKMRRVTDINLRLAFPELNDAEIDQLRVESINHTAMLLPEFAKAWFCSVEWLHDHIEAIHGEEVMDSALAAKGGVIVLVPHLGNWEILGQFLADRYDMTAMFMPPKISALGELILKARERFGMEMIAADRRGVGKLKQALANNRVTGILPDQAPSSISSGTYAPFFGHNALTVRMVSGLLKRTEAKVVMASAFRTEKGWGIHFERPDEAIYDADIELSVTAMNRSVEALVKLHPEQYQWEYKRYKRQPEGGTNYYK